MWTVKDTVLTQEQRDQGYSLAEDTWTVYLLRHGEIIERFSAVGVDPKEIRMAIPSPGGSL